MTRHINQMRPKNDPDAMAYSPQRDLANIYTPMLQEVFQGLDSEHWSPYLRQYLQEHQITEEDLGKSVSMIVEAHRLFIRDRAVNTPADAFEKAGATELPVPIRIAFFSRLGEVLMGGFFVALRDVTSQGRKPPADFTEMIAAGRTLAKRLSGHSSAGYTVPEAELYKADADELTRVVEQLQAKVDSLEIRNATLHDRFREVAPTQRAIDAVQRRNLISRVWYVAKIAWRIYRKLKL